MNFSARRIRAMLATAVVAVTAATTLALTVTSSAVGPAAAVTPLSATPHRGLGYAVGDDFVGFYWAGRDKIYCLSPSKALPSRVALTTTSRYGHLDAQASQALAFALDEWGDARTARAAATESQVLNTIVGNTAAVERRAAHLPLSMRPVVAAHVARARALHGPYTLAIAAGQAVLPGQSGTGTVRLRSASGRLVPGVTVRLSASANLTVPARVTTSANLARVDAPRRGIGSFPYRALDVGQMHIAATATGLWSTRLRASEPGRGYQHMVTWSPRTTARATTGFGATPGGFSDSYACTSTCRGNPTITLSACAAPGSSRSRIVFDVAGRTLGLSFAPSPRRTCRAVRTVASDGDRVSAAWTFRTPHGWSEFVDARGDFVVDCPPVPSVGVTLSYDCTSAGLRIALADVAPDGTWTALVNRTPHRMALLIGGARRETVIAAPGATAVFSTSVSCAAPVDYTARAAIQRAGGGWNYGQPETVRTPG